MRLFIEDYLAVCSLMLYLKYKKKVFADPLQYMTLGNCLDGAKTDERKGHFKDKFHYYESYYWLN